jgi:SAM-dependent methyltransferase
VSVLRSAVVRPISDRTTGYRLNQLVFGRQVAYLKKLLVSQHLEQGGVVLDIGCGTGDFSELFAADRYLGIDVLPGYLEWARKARGRSYEVCGFEDIGALQQSIGAAFGIGILHHVDDGLIARGLAQLAQKLAPGGRVFFVEPAWPVKRWNVIGWALRKLDRGAFVRDERGYLALFGGEFRVVASELHSVFPLDYHAFLLERTAREPHVNAAPPR